MTQDLMITTGATPGAVTLLDTFQPLERFDSHGYNRPDNLACISAGYKNEKGVPVVSRDGEIFISDPEGRAPGLAAVLKANNKRKLTIAVPSNNPADFIHQSYRKEGKTRLEAFGDDGGITVIGANGERTFYAAGTDGFEQLRKECKVSTNITFILAAYDDEGRPVYPFPDGFGTYRIRTTSANTVGNLMHALKMIAKYTGGHVAGFPLETSLAYRNVAGPNGDKRNVPVFVFSLKPPKALKLDSRTFGLIAAATREEIAMSVLALPEPESIDEAIAAYEVSAADAASLGSGINPEAERARWFTLVKGKKLDSAEARAAFIERYTDRQTGSLKQLLAGMTTQEEVEAFFAAVEHELAGRAWDRRTGEVGPTIDAEVVG